MIKTDRLSKRFRKVHALEELTFEVPEGAIYALLGPNGAGKTTLMKTLVNIWRPDNGRAWLLGTDSRRIGPGILQQIGYVSESQDTPGYMRVDEYLRYCRGFYPQWSDELASSLVSTLRLPLQRRFRALSRGERLKAALVSVLAYRPRVLLLDELFSGLDVLVRDEISETILTESGGATVLLASHDLSDLESFASHVGYLHEGRMLFSEEMPSLANRYRGVEVTLDDTDFQWPGHWPEDWLNPEHAQRVVRFTDSRFDPDRVREYFPGARDICTEPLSLRRIFVELARARRNGRHDLAHP